MITYEHRVQYYETDMMGITHHSNYIRWMEEARTCYTEALGFPYKKMEETGIVSPVLSVSVDYKKTSTYDDIIVLELALKEVRPVKYSVHYVMKKKGSDEIVCTADSVHAFLTSDGKPMMVDRFCPELYAAYKKEAEG